jgi:adenine/guanine phosphoribosyltransferase-like PRPP-binding protein
MTKSTKTVKDYIRTIVDFPHEGIMFRDVTTLFADPRGFRMAIDRGGPGFSTSFMPRSARAWFSYHAASFVFGFRLA